MINWIAAKPKRVLYLALTILAIIMGIIETEVASKSLQIIIGVPTVIIGSFLILLALGLLYKKEDWDDKNDN